MFLLCFYVLFFVLECNHKIVTSQEHLASDSAHYETKPEDKGKTRGILHFSIKYLHFVYFLYFYESFCANSIYNSLFSRGFLLKKAYPKSSENI